MDLDTTELKIGAHPALIVVDMINGFTDPSCPLGMPCTDIILANQSLLQAFRQAKLPVFFTTVIYRDATQAKVFRQKLPALNYLQLDSHWVKVAPQLDRLETEPLIEKQWASGFFKTNLDARLRSEKTDSLVITGLTTSGCVRATVVDGMQHDYPVIIPREAVGDRNQNAHIANLHDLNAKYAQVSTVSQVLTDLGELCR